MEAEEAVEDAMNDCLVETSPSVPSVSPPSFMPAKLVRYLCGLVRPGNRRRWYKTIDFATQHVCLFISDSQSILGDRVTCLAKVESLLCRFLSSCHASPAMNPSVAVVDIR